MNRFTVLFLMVASASITSGCATSQPLVFAKNGATETQLKHDWVTCKTKADSARLPLGHDSQFMQDCMQGEGWTTKTSDRLEASNSTIPQWRAKSKSTEMLSPDQLEAPNRSLASPQ